MDGKSLEPPAQPDREAGTSSRAVLITQLEDALARADRLDEKFAAIHISHALEILRGAD